MTLHTSKGGLNVELRCDLAPRTCENFLALCEMGYYDKTTFHRSIRNFMAQGGDPTATGTGGESIYGPAFPDELDSRLLHDRRGVLSMANSGKNTNGSQFFILYKSAPHLNFKHSVFGAVVGGLEALTAIEDTKTDSDDRPLQRIEITGAPRPAAALHRPGHADSSIHIPKAIRLNIRQAGARGHECKRSITCAQHAGCTIHRNPFRDMIAKEEEEAAAARAAEGASGLGRAHDAHKTGQWYSKPSASAQSLPVASVAAPGASAVSASSAAGAAAKPVRKAAPPAASEFDAW